jgi:hypothetical protein
LAFFLGDFWGDLNPAKVNFFCIPFAINSTPFFALLQFYFVQILALRIFLETILGLPDFGGFHPSRQMDGGIRESFGLSTRVV